MFTRRVRHSSVGISSGRSQVPLRAARLSSVTASVVGSASAVSTRGSVGIRKRILTGSAGQCGVCPASGVCGFLGLSAGVKCVCEVR